MDAAFNALGSYKAVVSTVTLRPVYVVDAPRQEQATPYKVWPYPMFSTAQAYYQAPEYGWKGNMLYPSKLPVQAGMGYATGQAPTSGVYTGIPSGCTSNGMTGSSPY